MQAAIELLRRELRELEQMTIESKVELASVRSGSEEETAVIAAAGSLMREYREISEALKLLIWAEEQAAEKRRQREELRNAYPH